jgi:hypothetical protein
MLLKTLKYYERDYVSFFIIMALNNLLYLLLSSGKLNWIFFINILQTFNISYKAYLDLVFPQISHWKVFQLARCVC